MRGDIFQMALWNKPAALPGASPIVYEFEPYGSLKAFEIVNNQINSTILSQYAPAIPSAYTGLALSANGAENGIVWLTTGNYDIDGVPGTLHALDATDLSNELWNSDLNSSRDQPGGLAKFAPPTVANGHVYVPTFSNAVSVYGPLNTPPTAATAAGSAVISSVVNSASYLEGPVSPGELVTIFGANFGPSSEAQGTLNGNSVSDTINGAQVLVSGVAAPLLFASSTQINAVVPFGVTGPTTQIQVVYQGQPIASTRVPVQAASPALFALDSTGGGPGGDPQSGWQRELEHPSSPAEFSRGSVRYRRRTHQAGQRGWYPHFSTLPVADASSFGYHQRPACPGALCGSRSGNSCRSDADQCGGARHSLSSQPRSGGPHHRRLCEPNCHNYSRASVAIGARIGSLVGPETYLTEAIVSVSPFSLPVTVTFSPALATILS